ncbi:hypothetical protein BH11PSE13_BH11PSE13_35580 [soil metagenome]
MNRTTHLKLLPALVANFNCHMRVNNFHLPIAVIQFSNRAHIHFFSERRLAAHKHLSQSFSGSINKSTGICMKHYVCTLIATFANAYCSAGVQS